MGGSGANVRLKNLTEEKIQEAIYQHGFLSHSSIKYYTENLWIYGWESDIWIMTKSGYSYETEIKISRNDFKNDFKHKKNKHLLLESNDAAENKRKPNYFYYAVPEGLISVEEVPEYAGLLYIVPLSDTYNRVDVVKKAPQIHKDKADIEFLNLIDKFYFNYSNWKAKYKGYERNVTKILDEVRTFDGTKYSMTLPMAMNQIEFLEYRVKLLETENDMFHKRLIEETVEFRQELREKNKKIRELEGRGENNISESINS